MSATFELSILGCNSAFPSVFRNPSCQYLKICNQHFIIDCGEGAQRMMGRMKVPKHKISRIFISHLHGDHFFGLPGLLNSLSLGGREEKLVIYSPPGLKGIIEELQKLSGAAIVFPLEFVELEEDKASTIFESEDIRVESFPVQHRVPCFGYAFYEKKTTISLDPEILETYEVPVEKRSAIARGEDYISADGIRMEASVFEKQRKRPRSYAYCTDTLFDLKHIEYFKGVDLLYHEATFEHALLDKALYSMHTTALQAGELAKEAAVGYLLLGHFSNRYRSTERLAAEAQRVFDRSYTVEDGMRIRLDHEGDKVKMLISY